MPKVETYVAVIAKAILSSDEPVSYLVRDRVDGLKFSTVKGGMFPNQICDFIEANFPQFVREKERREIDWRHNVSCTLSRMKCFDNGEYGRNVIRPDHLWKFTKDNK